MRTITQSDISSAARRLLLLPDDQWRDAIARALAIAHAADLFCKRLGRCHPIWGDGTLAAAVRVGGRLPAEPFLSDRRYLAAVGEVIDVILEWRSRQNVKSPLARAGFL